MERTSTSMTYSQLGEKYQETIAEQEHRHMWLFLYSGRHAHLQLLRPDAPKGLSMLESDQLIDDTAELLQQFVPPKPWQIIPPGRQLVEELHHFCFAITYTFHRKHFADGFIDPRFEDLRPTYELFIDNLNPDKKAVVSQLHELTYKYGFVITELWDGLIDSQKLIDAFTKKRRKSEKIDKIPTFIFTKKESRPNGIQISTKKYQQKPTKPWDLAIFFNEGEKFSKIKEEIVNTWRKPTQKIIGNPENYQIALYVDRNKCKIRQLTDTLRLQVDQLDDYKNGLILIPTSVDDIVSDKDKIKSKIKEEKKMRKDLSSFIDRIRLSESLIFKHWSIERSNVRRSIGLYLWDHMNIIKPSLTNRKRLIKGLIEKIRSETPDALDFYLEKFNKHDSARKTTKFGDSELALETVVREMEADYYLTNICIENCEYLIPHDVKVGGNKY